MGGGWWYRGGLGVYLSTPLPDVYFYYVPDISNVWDTASRYIHPYPTTTPSIFLSIDIRFEQ